jgi:cAMP phosphodiesterase
VQNSLILQPAVAASTTVQELQALVVQLSQPSSTGSSSNSSWYVLQRPGPSSFVVGQDPGDDKFKVALGNQPTCSCRWGWWRSY